MKEKVQRQQKSEKMNLRTSTVCKQTREKHDSINLPRNLCCSDESDVECSLSDDNDQDEIHLHRTKPEPPMAELTHNLENMSFNENGTSPVNEEVLRRFAALSLHEKYEKILEYILVPYQRTTSHTVSKVEDYTARSPIRNKETRQSKYFQTPLDRPDLTVTSILGNKGNVYVQKPREKTLPSFIPLTVSNYTTETIVPQDTELLEYIKDKTFIDDFLLYLEKTLTVESKPEGTPRSKQRSPMETMDQCLISPLMISPVTSPNNHLDDSSYETGSPGSTVGMSPAPRTSVSSDSDLELDPAIEHCPLQCLPTNIVIVAAQPSNRLAFPIKTEPDVKPLGEVVHFVKTSATDRLEEMSQSTLFCKKQYAIQLYKVALIFNDKTTDDRLQRLSKSLLETLKMKLNKANDIDIWMLSLFAHIELMTASNRIQEYRSALLSCDEKLHSLLYIAAVTQNEKPLMARYIVESLAKVGYNPLEVYDNKNTILHLLADLGDSHRDVLSELLMATGADGKPLLDLAATNAKGQSALHVAVLSPHQHLTTVLILLKMGANPFQEDIHHKTPLYYQIMSAAKQEPRSGENLEVLRKMIWAQPLRTREELERLGKMCADSFVPSDLTAIIQAEITFAQEVKPKRIERR